ncbi:major capsid protein [Ruminococcus sp.]|uniref:major capsid protein n=1 Tax=Ruminococcus sp. TaxID=41978 RepID=UPI00266C8CA2|nr:major capsid protein [uncultured Ruminococcus sp.]
MILSDVFTAESVAANWTEAASNATLYYGAGLFPAKKKAGLDLKWICGNKGLPVSLAPSAFDTKSSLRDRIGIKLNKAEMAFFRESMLVKEADEQEILRVQDAGDPYAVDVLERVFDDAQTLIDGANVVPERMIMQLLAPLGGKMGIEIQADGVDYTYNYDPDGSWKKQHYLELKGAAKWSASDTCDPMQVLEDAMDAQETLSGNRPAVVLMSKATFQMMKQSKKLRDNILSQNLTANVNYSTARVKAYVEEELQVTLVIYSKQYRKEDGTAAKFYPDNILMLLPDGELGSTYYGTTPEERTLMQDVGADVTLVNTGVAVAVTRTNDPVHTKTTVSEIVLPSFERMEECYAIEVA